MKRMKLRGRREYSIRLFAISDQLTMTESTDTPDKAARPARTLERTLALIRNKNLPLLKLDPLPSDFLPELIIPGVDEASFDGHEACDAELPSVTGDSSKPID